MDFKEILIGGDIFADPEHVRLKRTRPETTKGGLLLGTCQGESERGSHPGRMVERGTISAKNTNYQIQ